MGYPCDGRMVWLRQTPAPSPGAGHANPAEAYALAAWPVQKPVGHSTQDMHHIPSQPARRSLLLAVITACVGAASDSMANELGAPASLSAIEQTIGGRLGVFVVDTATQKTIEHRPDERFAMCSTFKWLLAAQFLHQVDLGTVRPQEQVPFDRGDLLDYSRVSKSKVQEGRIALSEAAAAAVTFSDNTAANLLLKRLGGPPALTRYARGLGDAVTRLDRQEPGLNENALGDLRDTTSPRAMVSLLQAVFLGDALSTRSREQLLGWLRSSATGYARLRAGLPRDWRVGDKTGTGGNGAFNTVGIAIPPGREPLLFAVYVSESPAVRSELERAHAQVASVAVATLQ